MKKFLSILGLIAILGLTTPAMAAPMDHHRGPHHNGGPRPGHAKMHRPPMHHHNVHHHRGGITFHAGHPRHSYWHAGRYSYWNDPWYNPGLVYSTYSPYYIVPGASFSIRF